jgi:hypothetical protein
LESQDLVTLKTSVSRDVRGFSYVKLHGSMHWRSSRNAAAMVLGVAKEEQIDKEPLLHYYFELFETAINRPNVVICIVGYGFRDAHINRRLARAVSEHGARLVVVSPDAPEALSERLLLAGADGGELLWGAIDHWPYSLVDMFPQRSSARDLSVPALNVYRSVFADFDTHGR